MPNKVMSLGDEEVKLIRETYDLPKGRKEILQLLSEVLNRGGVQRIVISLGDPVKVDRNVKALEVLPEAELVGEEDVYSATRNAEMHVLVRTSGSDVLSYLAQAYSYLGGEKLRARWVLARRYDLLEKWLNLIPGVRLSDLFGARILEYGEIPADALLLVGSTELDPELPAASVRLEMA